MAEVLLFHHAQGLTPGVVAFADDLRGAGHTVHTPDLLDGRLFDSIPEGMAYVEELGFDEILRRGTQAAAGLPTGLVYAGFSLGEMPAQKLAQTRPGARGALLFYSCIPISGEWAFGPWPEGVPVQIHGMDADPFFVGEGDINAAREIVATVPDAELFLYPGDQHYFADSSLPSFDAGATALLTHRVLDFLNRVQCWTQERVRRNPQHSSTESSSAPSPGSCRPPDPNRSVEPPQRDGYAHQGDGHPHPLRHPGLRRPPRAGPVLGRDAGRHHRLHHPHRRGRAQRRRAHRGHQGS
jgi:dienelactone hydrolase